MTTVPPQDYNLHYPYAEHKVVQTKHTKQLKETFEWL